MRNSHKLIAVIFLTALLTVGCKPTVDNYRAAYETALQKERQGVDDEIYEKMRLEAEPRVTVVGNDSVRTRVEPLSVYNSDGSTRPAVNKCNVAVGQYKMPVNAKAHCSRLTEEGYNAYMMKNSEAVIYVIAGGFPSLEEAAPFVSEYVVKHPGRLVGMSAPIVLMPSNLMR